MSGMIWDEVTRVWTAIGALAVRIGYELDEGTVVRIEEAVRALEAAIAEAWPPEPVITPVRTGEAVPPTWADLPMEELAALVAAGAMPVPMSEERRERPIRGLRLSFPAPKRDLLPDVLATTAAQDDLKPIEMIEGVHYRTGPDGRRTALQQPLSGYGVPPAPAAEQAADQWRKDNGMRPRQPGEQFMRVGDCLAPHILIGAPSRP